MSEPEVRSLSESIGAQLRTVRTARGLTLEKLAEHMAKYGSKISRATLANYETGESVIRLDDAVIMSFVLRVSLAELVLAEGDKEPIALGPSGPVTGSAIWKHLMTPSSVDQPLFVSEHILRMNEMFREAQQKKEDT